MLNNITAAQLGGKLAGAYLELGRAVRYDLLVRVIKQSGLFQSVSSFLQSSIERKRATLWIALYCVQSVWNRFRPGMAADQHLTITIVKCLGKAPGRNTSHGFCMFRITTIEFVHFAALGRVDAPILAHVQH